MQQTRIAWPPLTRGIKFLLIAYGTLFLFQQFWGTMGVRVFLESALYLSNDGFLGHYYLWQPLTYQFLHADVFHLFFNALVLYSFGGEVEQRWGSVKHLIGYTVLCGLGAAVFIVVSQLIFPGVEGVSGFGRTPTVGASGGIYGVVTAFCIYNWNKPLRMMFVPVAIRAKWLLPAFILLDVIMTLGARAPISLSGHVGGLVTGALIVTGFYKPQRLMDHFRLWRARRRLRLLRGGHPLEKDPDNPPKNGYYH